MAPSVTDRNRTRAEIERTRKVSEALAQGEPNAVDEHLALAEVDYAELKQGTRVGGAHLGRAWSPWSTSSNAAVSVTFKSDKRSCAPGGPCPVDGGVPAEGNYPYWGVAVTAYEVKQWEPGAKQMTTPLRFPGQYFDAETGRTRTGIGSTSRSWGGTSRRSR